MFGNSFINSYYVQFIITTCRISFNFLLFLKKNSSQVSEVTHLCSSWPVSLLSAPLASPTCNPEPRCAQTRSVLCKMSACSEFAEHVWKPGSCKNCFHPRSAHANTKGRKSLCGDEEEDEGASASPYIKPTIAVKPTMMNLDTTETAAEFTMNTQQVFERKLLHFLFMRTTHTKRQLSHNGTTTIYVHICGVMYVFKNRWLNN